MNRFVSLAWGAIASLVLAGCGGSSSSGSSPPAAATTPPAVVLVAPASDVLGPSGVRTFTTNVPVSWSVQEGAAGGDITADGVYTAPGTAGLFHVRATSIQDPGASAVAQVTVVSTGYFQPTGSMGTARTAHTATLLKDGRVLIAGGNACHSGGGDCPLDTAEIYNPGTGTFAATGRMSSKRYFHTATLLDNGKVLVTGGGSATAELFDPASGTFSATGSMSVGRLYGTATLLADGKVLIAGGASTQYLGGAFATSELYDPDTETFKGTGTMNVARGGHTATLLANGKVLLAGGWNDAGRLQSAAELYDPATGSFTLTGSMAEPRELHAAAPLGASGVLVIGGDNGWDMLASAEVYDVATGTFAVTGSMAYGRYGIFAAPLASGRVLVSGGYFTAELFDAASGLFAQTGSMPASREYPAVVVLQDGRLLVTGGSDTSSAELYQ